METIFTPYATQQREKFYGDEPHKQSAKFVHYTSADAALKIITSKRLWMRNTTCMTDYREVQHGYDILKKFFREESNEKAFLCALDSCAPKVGHEAIAAFDRWWADIRFHTYVTSLSEHDESEDIHGRLSMWRAFGGGGPRVALVFNVPRFSEGANHLKLLFSPVAYPPENHVHDGMKETIRGIESNRDFLRSVDRPELVTWAFYTLLARVTCLKHEGFREEREWRAVYSPTRMKSDFIRPATEVITGVPQLIYQLPLDKSVSALLADLDFSHVFDRLIIGPSQYAFAMRDAFVTALETAGVTNPAQRIFPSGIPIRS